MRRLKHKILVVSNSDLYRTTLISMVLRPRYDCEEADSIPSAVVMLNKIKDISAVVADAKIKPTQAHDYISVANLVADSYQKPIVFFYSGDEPEDIGQLTSRKIPVLKTGSEDFNNSLLTKLDQQIKEYIVNQSR